MEGPKPITSGGGGGGVRSAGMLSRNHIGEVSCSAGICSGREHTWVKRVGLCYKDVVDCTGRQPLLLHLPNRTGSCQFFWQLTFGMGVYGCVPVWLFDLKWEHFSGLFGNMPSQQAAYSELAYWNQFWSFAS